MVEHVDMKLIRSLEVHPADGYQGLLSVMEGIILHPQFFPNIKSRKSSIALNVDTFLELYLDLSIA